MIYRERDGLLEQLSSLKAQYTALRQREEEAYEQVKSSVQLVEQSQMELTQVHSSSSTYQFAFFLLKCMEFEIRSINIDLIFLF